MVGKPKVVAVVQARMGSTRLPGKVLLDILHKPMLWHIINRVLMASRIDRIIIASTTDQRDDRIEEFAKANGYAIYRGSVDDIVDRFCNAAKEADADLIVRIWGDCPLIDPRIIDRTVELLQAEGADYANNFNPPSFPVGMNVEVYELGTLTRIYHATEDPFYREYPFQFVYDRKDEFKTAFLSCEQDLSSINWTVDYPQDLEMVRYIYERLYREGEAFDLQEILALVRDHPALSRMNKGLDRNIEFKKDLEERKKGAGRLA